MFRNGYYIMIVGDCARYGNYREMYFGMSEQEVMEVFHSELQGTVAEDALKFSFEDMLLGQIFKRGDSRRPSNVKAYHGDRMGGFLLMVDQVKFYDADDNVIRPSECFRNAENEDELRELVELFNDAAMVD